MAQHSLTKTRYGRRLLLIVGLFAAGLLILAAQSSKLTVVEGEALLAEAESRLVRQRWTPSTRGRIRDRAGRVLAYDRPSFDIAVDYSVITGEWAQRQAARAARRRAENWATLSREQRSQTIVDMVPEFVARTTATWDLIAQETGLSPAEVAARKFRVSDQVDRMAEHVRTRRTVTALRAYAGSLGISEAELQRRTQAIDRPDVQDDAARLRYALAREITVEAERAIERAVAEELSEETVPHVIVHAVDDEVGFKLRRLAAETDDEGLPRYPGLSIQQSHARDYPMRTVEVGIDRSVFPPPLRSDTVRTTRVRGVASHLLGSVRRGVYAEDDDRRSDALAADADLAARATYPTPSGPADLGQYFPGDSVGHTGLERSLEDELRGLRGLRIDRLDESEAETVPPAPGRDVALTLDIMLQSRIQALLDPANGLTSVQPWHDNTVHVDANDPMSPLMMPPGTPMDAAAVVLDVDTGEILAMVSTPSFLPDGSDLPQRVDERERYLAVRRPYVNRAVSMPLPPGSIAKAVVLCGAHARGLLGDDERIACTGHFLEGQTDRLRCWIFKRNPGMTHDMSLGHSPDGAEALKVSCNIFFYTLGQRLGPDGIADLYRSFGVGEPWDLPVDGALRGFLGPYGKPDAISPGDAILMGIGQGPIAWTPLHAADAFATIGRGGIRIKPRLVLDQPAETTDLGLDPAIVDTTLHGLWLATNDERGTAHSIPYNGRRFNIFDAEGIQVWGKTGTATAPPLVVDGETVRRGDHSWFVLLCGRDRPRYAISVVAEYGGSGGRVSGPIANQIIHALVAEGYL